MRSRFRSVPSKDEFSKKCQFSKNKFSQKSVKISVQQERVQHKHQFSKDEFSKKCQFSKIEFSKKYQFSANISSVPLKKSNLVRTFSMKYQFSKNEFSKKCQFSKIELGKIRNVSLVKKY